MISFNKIESNIIAVYTTQSESIDWLYDKFRNDDSYSFQKTFTFSKDDLIGALPDENEVPDPFNRPPPVNFLFASLVDDYYQVRKGVLTNKFDVFISSEVDVIVDLFVAESDISIYKKLEDIIDEDIYIGGINSKAIPENTFVELINRFPSAYEKKLYAEAKIVSLIKEYFSTTKDVEGKYQRYLNKKESIKGQNLLKTFQDIEIEKYSTIYEKLDRMLLDENCYSEKQWQDEILQIILLLYPKYISVFTSVSIKAEKDKEKQLDYLLVDANGHIDIIEIKKPFESSIVTAGLYRDNYIPLRELSGTVMQIEKYIYYLNRWSVKGERHLTNKYKHKLPENFEINITNPSALIIMGRENKLNKAQKNDFEVVKRKYKNVIDILTYDNLLHRLRFTIEQIKKI